MNFISHHLHKRKRIHEKFEKYPHPDPKIRFLDNAMMAIAVFGPLANVSQIIKIFSEKSSVGLSVSSWIMYACFNVFWISYGLAHKERPIIISSFLWLLTQIVVLTGVVIYQG